MILRQKIMVVFHCDHVTKTVVDTAAIYEWFSELLVSKIFINFYKRTKEIRVYVWSHKYDLNSTDYVVSNCKMTSSK
jgi:hypothetical protein